MRAGLGSSALTPFQTPTDRLFLGVFPDPEITVRMSTLSRNLRIGYELRGKPTLPGRLHVTLHHIGDGFGLDPEVVALAEEVAANIAMPPFLAEFNSVQSFRHGAFVLRGDDGIVGFEMMQQRLGAAMEKAGLGKAFRNYTPHVTLLRDDHLVDDHPITPIGWWVREFVLVHSFLGQTQYEFLARFPLR
jgi:RNA 2',3'-cyclic 3'-phosphodiesterase